MLMCILDPKGGQIMSWLVLWAQTCITMNVNGCVEAPKAVKIMSLAPKARINTNVDARCAFWGRKRDSKSCLGGLLRPNMHININVDARLRAQTVSKSCLGWFCGLKKRININVDACLWPPKRVRIMSGLALGVHNSQKIEC